MVRPAVTSDLSSVRDLVEGVEGREGVMSDVVRGVEGGRDSIKDGATPLSALVAECADQIVGVAVVRREEVRTHYSCLIKGFDTTFFPGVAVPEVSLQY